MNNNPLVSVLMTSYNREKYIAEAIESVLASTYSNFELIICDDCSKDKTVEIAKFYAANDARVKVYLNEKNLGDYPNRNQAASYATGKYLKYVDADDKIYPWGLEILVNCMEQYPDAGWGLCSLIQVKEKPYPILLSPNQAYKHHFFVNGIFQKAPLSSIIKKEVFDEVNGFKPIRMAGDFEMWHRLAQQFKVLLMPDGIVWYREHNEQEMNTYLKFVKQYEQIKVQYLTHELCPLSKEDACNAINHQKKQIKKNIIKALIRSNFKQVKAELQRLSVYD